MMTVFDRSAAHDGNDGPDRYTAATAWQVELGSRQRIEIEAAAKEAHMKDIAAANLTEFKKVLSEKFGNMARAWRIMDSDGNGKLSFMEWCQACRATGYNGDVRSIWKELDDDESGIVAFEELAPEEYEPLLEFKKALRSTYKTHKEAWHKLLDLEHEFNIDVNEFTSRVPKIGVKKPKKLFKLVIPQKGGKYIHIEDIEWVWNILDPLQKGDGPAAPKKPRPPRAAVRYEDAHTPLHFETLSDWNKSQEISFRMDSQDTFFQPSDRLKALDLEDIQVALQFLVRHNVMTPGRLAAFMNQLTSTRLSTANAKLLLHVCTT